MYSPYSHGISKDDRIFSSCVFSISYTTKQQLWLGTAAINQDPNTHIEHNNTTFSLILDQEIFEGVVRRFLSIQKVST